MKDFPEFILASRSPRRADLLTEAGYRFQVVPPPLAEPPDAPGAAPGPLAEALAYFKARSVQARRPDRIVLGADTVVAHEGEIFGKARDADDARRLLATIAGTRHAVTTGLAVLVPARRGGEPHRLLAADTTAVTVKPLTDEQVDAYVASGEWRDKAGAYAIQETADAFVERIEGSFTNVVGLPMELLERVFERARRLAATEA